MNKTLKKSLAALVAYNWDDEFQDFKADENDSREVHIFRDIVAIDNFLNGTNRTPESYL